MTHSDASRDDSLVEELCLGDICWGLGQEWILMLSSNDIMGCRAQASESPGYTLPYSIIYCAPLHAEGVGEGGGGLVVRVSASQPVDSGFQSPNLCSLTGETPEYEAYLPPLP